MSSVFASIDIGSNAVRLLFANVYSYRGRVISEKATLTRIPVRLGLDVFETGKISEYRQELLVRTLKAFKLLIEVYKPLSYIACATAAMREAKNRDSVLELINKETGFDVEVISGEQEAELISTFNNFNLDKKTPYILYVDVGGGSTELSLLQDNNNFASGSFNIGTIRLLNNRVEESEWDKMERWLTETLPEGQKIHCVGSGGNINKLVKLFGNTSQRSITQKRLRSAYYLLRSLSVEKRLEMFGMRNDRADVIVPAAEIFLRIIKVRNIKRVIAPKFGLADGLAIKQFLDHQKSHSV